MSQEDKGNASGEELAKSAASSTGGFVSLPFDQTQFRDFVVSLLGRPQTIEKRVYCKFAVNLEDIANFHHLINQRLTQQNKAALAQFRAKIYFSNNSSITINSFDELLAYREVRPLESVGVDLSWDYLIMFNDKTHPEKQGIDVRIWTSYANVRGLGSEDGIVIIGSSATKSFINLTIRHTARTWGMDMEALLTSHIESLAHPASPVRDYIRKHSVPLGLLSGALFFLGSVYGALWGTDLFVRESLDRVRNSLEIAKDVSSKVAVLAKYIASGDATRHYFSVGLFLIIAFIISIFVAFIIENQADSEEPSFVLLTTGALRMQQKQIRRIRAQWKRFLVSILISLGTNIASSYIFIHLSRKGI